MCLSMFYRTHTISFLHILAVAPNLTNPSTPASVHCTVLHHSELVYCTVLYNQNSSVLSSPIITEGLRVVNKTQHKWITTTINSTLKPNTSIFKPNETKRHKQHIQTGSTNELDASGSKPRKYQSHN